MQASPARPTARPRLPWYTLVGASVLHSTVSWRPAATRPQSDAVKGGDATWVFRACQGGRQRRLDFSIGAGDELQWPFANEQWAASFQERLARRQDFVGASESADHGRTERGLERAHSLASCMCNKLLRR